MQNNDEYLELRIYREQVMFFSSKVESINNGALLAREVIEAYNAMIPMDQPLPKVKWEIVRLSTVADSNKEMLPIRRRPGPITDVINNTKLLTDVCSVCQERDGKILCCQYCPTDIYTRLVEARNAGVRTKGMPVDPCYSCPLQAKGCTGNLEEYLDILTRET